MSMRNAKMSEGSRSRTAMRAVPASLAFLLLMPLGSNANAEDFPRSALPAREIAQTDLITIPSAPGFHLFGRRTVVAGRRMVTLSEDPEREVLVYRGNNASRWILEAEIPRPASPDTFGPVDVALDGDTLALLRIYRQNGVLFTAVLHLRAHHRRRLAPRHQPLA